MNCYDDYLDWPERSTFYLSFVPLYFLNYTPEAPRIHMGILDN